MGTGIGEMRVGMAFRIAGWALFGMACALFGAAEVRARLRGTTPPGSMAPFLTLLAIILALGITATTTSSNVVTGLFVWCAIVPWVGLYKKVRERRAKQPRTSNS